MILVSHESVCKRHWDGHLAILVKIDGVRGFIDNMQFLILRLTNPLSVSVSLTFRSPLRF